ncbi:hypothetical protein KI688_012953 [Linnemannia hyalina]|uniref:Protein kinase domain-containing protein n=1 Tax=Linnemannia hyalina TaxID=64524 RepID=A0A9P7XTV6_9FUNG|nr:hypothetical protein KI688_012953 [Linnemannia hyalina]
MMSRAKGSLSSVFGSLTVKCHTLDTLFKTRRTLQEYKVRYFGQQLVTSVAHLHSLSLVHHDLKPLNLLLIEELVLKVGDFDQTQDPRDGKEFRTLLGVTYKLLDETAAEKKKPILMAIVRLKFIKSQEEEANRTLEEPTGSLDDAVEEEVGASAQNVVGGQLDVAQAKLEAAQTQEETEPSEPDVDLGDVDLGDIFAEVEKVKLAKAILAEGA